MNRKLCLIVGAVLIVAAFLLGFVPQYLKGRDLESQLSAVRQQLELGARKITSGRAWSAQWAHLPGNRPQELWSGEPILIKIL